MTQHLSMFPDHVGVGEEARRLSFLRAMTIQDRSPGRLIAVVAVIVHRRPEPQGARTAGTALRLSALRARAQPRGHTYGRSRATISCSVQNSLSAELAGPHRAVEELEADDLLVRQDPTNEDEQQRVVTGALGRYPVAAASSRGTRVHRSSLQRTHVDGFDCLRPWEQVQVTAAGPRIVQRIHLRAEQDCHAP